MKEITEQEEVNMLLDIIKRDVAHEKTTPHCLAAIKGMGLKLITEAGEIEDGA